MRLYSLPLLHDMLPLLNLDRMAAWFQKAITHQRQAEDRKIEDG
jgi:hypothetical protein